MKKTFDRQLKRKLLTLLLCMCAWGMAWSQTTIKGVITRETNEPLSGAVIKLIGSGTTTFSDKDGSYIIIVPSNKSELEFSYVGLKHQTVTVGDRTTINIVMKDDDKLLNEVVVVGYGIQKKVNVTGAVTSINFDELADSRPITSISASLSGLAAGLSARQTSGRPGDNSAMMRVRGVKTMNDNTPLIVVDGIVAPSMDNLNPNDIESISILKDAASAAIYGARAGAGVILITTKSGTKEGKPIVNFTSRFATMNPVNLPNVVTNYADYMELMNEAHYQAKNNPMFNQDVIDLWREKSLDPNGLTDGGYPNYVAYPNTDWMRETYNKNQILQEYNVSTSGGSNKSRYLMSFGYMDNPGIVDNTSMERMNMRINFETDITKWLTLGTRTYGHKDKSGRLTFDGNDGVNGWILQSTPGIYPLFDGKYGSKEAEQEENGAVNIRRRIDENDNGREDFMRLNTTIFSKISFMKGLSLTSNLNYERTWFETSNWTNPRTTAAYSFSRGLQDGAFLTPNEFKVSNGHINISSYTLEHLLNFDRSFGEHDVTALLGYHEEYWKRGDLGATRRGLIDETIHDLDSATELLDGWGKTHDRASRAILGRLTYAFKSRYLFEYNMRYDGHSRFQKDYRWGLFPSVSGGWRISEEAFMAGTKGWLDNLKLRLSWGKNGNYGSNTMYNDYISQPKYARIKYSLNGKQTDGLVIPEVPNTSLTWETTQTTNLGLDANFLRNRLSLEMDVFSTKSSGILQSMPIPLTAGVKGEPVLNLADMKSKGVEITTGWRDRVSDFSYGVSANFAWVRNETTKFRGKLKEGWVEDKNGKLVWQTNFGEVAKNYQEAILEGYEFEEYFLRSIYHGNGQYFDADGNVMKDGGPGDGMIRTEDDMKWAKAMAQAGYSFHEVSKVGERDGLYYGDYIFDDYNGDKIYGNDYDRRAMGTSKHPKYNFGLQLDASWKGFDIFLNFAGAAGFDIFWSPRHGYNASTTTLVRGKAISKDIADDHYFYDPNNPSDPRTNINAKYRRLSTAHTSSTRQPSDLYLFKGDYLKLKTLVFGYTIPTVWTNKIGLNKARMYFSGENLFSIDSFPGVDPEQGGDPKYQPVKQYAFGINLTF